LASTRQRYEPDWRVGVNVWKNNWDEVEKVNIEERIREAKPQYKRDQVDKQKFISGVFERLGDKKVPIMTTRMWKRRRFVSLAATAVVLLGLFCTGFASAEVASAIKQIPLIGTAFNLLQNSYFGSINGINRATQKGFNIDVNQTATDKGITLTIGNAYCEEDEMAFDMVESFDDHSTKHPVIRDEDMQIDIDGKRKMENFSGGEFRLISGNRYGGIVWFRTYNMSPYEPFPKSFTLNVHITQMGDVKGNWSFAIPMTRSGTHSATKEFHPMTYSKSANGMKLLIKDISIAPSQTKVNFELRQALTMNHPEVPHFRALDAYDQNGTRLNGYIPSMSNRLK
jgi:hypothetical protein